MEEPVSEERGEPVLEIASSHFQNPWNRSMKLLAARELLLWWRDKYQIKARIMQGICIYVVFAYFVVQAACTCSHTLSVLRIDLIMGIICGTVFWQ